jgi:hypothetical protein
MIQGMTSPTDSSIQILRDINYRYITVENSSNRPIGIAIRTYIIKSAPEIDYIIPGGAILHLNINSQGGPTQYIYLLDPQSKKLVGEPTCIMRTSNQLVLRDGLNMWFVSFFHRPTYRGAS